MAESEILAAPVEAGAGFTQNRKAILAVFDVEIDRLAAIPARVGVVKSAC